MGTRLQVMYERSRICQFVHAKLVAFKLKVRLIKIKVEVSATSDAARPEKQRIYLPRAYGQQLYTININNFLQ